MDGYLIALAGFIGITAGMVGGGFVVLSILGLQALSEHARRRELKRHNARMFEGLRQRGADA